jgi:hypothetical protein
VIRSVFVPVSLGEAEKAIAMYDLAKLGMELIPIPAMGGCVIAIREITRAKSTPAPRLRVPWLDQVKSMRAELRVRSVLRTLSLAHTGGDA